MNNVQNIPRDILDNLEITPESIWQQPLFLLLVILTALTTVVVLYLLYKVFLYKAQPIDPDVALREEIKNLKEQNNNNQTETKKLYFSLIFAFKSYLKNKLDINIQDKTDSELIPMLKLSGKIKPQTLEKITTLVENSFLARFVQEDFDPVKIDCDLVLTQEIQALIQKASEKSNLHSRSQ